LDWNATRVSLWLATATCVLLLPFALWLGRRLAIGEGRLKPLIEAAVMLPLLLPPTVIGFYLLVAFGSESWLGQLYERLFGQSLIFSFEGLLIASMIVNIPFAVQPIQRAFEAIAPELRDAAATCGMSGWRMGRRIERPLTQRAVVLYRKPKAQMGPLVRRLGQFFQGLALLGDVLAQHPVMKATGQLQPKLAPEEPVSNVRLRLANELAHRTCRSRAGPRPAPAPLSLRARRLQARLGTRRANPVAPPPLPGGRTRRGRSARGASRSVGAGLDGR